MSESTAVEGSGVDAQIASEDQARQLVEEIRKQFGRTWEAAAQLQQEQDDLISLIDTAYNSQAWLPLGYESWKAMCEAEFSAVRVRQEVSARRERVDALIAAGLSDRAVGAVLGVHHRTVQRDALATGANAPVAEHVAKGDPRTETPERLETSKVLGLDGKVRERRRATPAKIADRTLLVGQRRDEGWTQDEIAESLEDTVTQRTISYDEERFRKWKADLSAPDVKRLESGQMSRAEFAERANLEIVQRDRRRLDTGARNGARALAEGLRFLSESVVYADAWLEERSETSAILAGTLANVAGEGTEWMALDFDYEDVPDEELQLLSDDLGRAAEWAHQARRRLVSAAEARGVELDPEGYREELEAKVEGRRGRRR